MAYVQTPDDQNAQTASQTNTTGVQPPPQTSSTGTASAVSGSPQGAAAIPSTTKAPPVQNLQAYLAANAPQAVQSGQNIANGLTAQANQVTGDINADQTATDQQIQAQNVAPNQTLINQAASNPSAFVQDPNNVTAFQQQENANYTGPATYESTPDYTTLQNEVTNAQNDAPNINEPGGLQQLVTGQEKNPTVGEENLDTLLLQENPDAVAPITQALSAYPNLGTALSNSAQTEDQNINQAITNDQQDPALINSAFFTGPNAVVPAWESALQGEQAMDTGEANTYNQALNNLISSENSATPDISAVENALSSYNTSANGYSQNDPLFGATSTLPQINGINLGFNNPSAINAPTLNQSATTQDVAEQNALEQLLGKGFTPEITDTTQAGSFQNPGNAPTLQSLLQSNLGTLGTDLTGAENAYTANGRLTPQGTPANSIVNTGIAPAGDVAVNGALPKGATNPIFIPGNGTTGGQRGTVAQTANTNYGGIPQSLNQNAVTGISTLSPIANGQTSSDGTPFYTSNAQLPALQQAYQTLQQYLAAQGS